MRGLALFLMGVLVGILVIQPTAAQQQGDQALNHVGISVDNFDEAINFYTETMGFREAFAISAPDGTPRLTYLHINRDTFLEIQPANPNNPAGFTHVGIQVDDLEATVRRLGSEGLEAEQPRSGSTNALLTNVFGPGGARIELVELGPDSLHTEAMRTWEPTR